MLRWDFFAYDDASRVTKRSYELDFYSSALSDSFSYNANGLLSSMTATNGYVIAPEYNSLKQIDRVKMTNSSNTSYTYYKDYSYKAGTGAYTTNLPNKISYFKSDGTTKCVSKIL